MVCVKVVCDRWCVKDGVSKMVCDRGAEAEVGEAEAGYRIKNKNPTQRCGEKHLC